jgi:hypothetical protein
MSWRGFECIVRTDLSSTKNSFIPFNLLFECIVRTDLSSTVSVNVVIRVLFECIVRTDLSSTGFYSDFLYFGLSVLLEQTYLLPHP